MPFIIVREVCMWMEGIGGGGGVALKVNIYSFATQSASCLPSNYGLHENVQEELCNTTRISSLVVLYIQILLVFLLQLTWQ